jgi:hypothetical protein
LQISQLLFLIGREAQSFSEKRRQNLAGLRRSAKPTGTATESTRSASTRTTPRPARTTGALSPIVLGKFRIQLGGQGDQFFLGHDAIFICIGLIEEAMKPFVRHFILGHLSVLILGERQHPTDDRRLGVILFFCRIGG